MKKTTSVRNQKASPTTQAARTQQLEVVFVFDDTNADSRLEGLGERNSLLRDRSGQFYLADTVTGWKAKGGASRVLMEGTESEYSLVSAAQLVTIQEACAWYSRCDQVALDMNGRIGTLLQAAAEMAESGNCAHSRGKVQPKARFTKAEVELLESEREALDFYLLPCNSDSTRLAAAVRLCEIDTRLAELRGLPIPKRKFSRAPLGQARELMQTLGTTLYFAQAALGWLARAKDNPGDMSFYNDPIPLAAV